jgi:hypothetical protein
VKAALRVLLTLALATTPMAGCAGPPSLGACPKLAPPPEGLGALAAVDVAGELLK